MIRAGVVLVALALTASTSHAAPQARDARDESTGRAGLRSMVGAEVIARLLQSADPEERLRGIERAASSELPDAMELLVGAAEPAHASWSDPRALLLLARGLARHATHDRARGALVNLLHATRSGPGSRAATVDAGDTRMLLVRQTAAMALGASQELRAADALVQAARSNAPGRSAATMALAAYPHPHLNALVGSGATSTALIDLAGELGDLRLVEPVRASISAPESAARASALVALAHLGDGRAIEWARRSLTDADARVRIAAAHALLDLHAPDAESSIAALLTDKATSGAAVRLAEHPASEALVKALAAHAKGAPSVEERALAIAALGGSPHPFALEALFAFMPDPILQGDAAHALSRSPQAAAARWLERALQDPKHDLLALRACLVRQWRRTEPCSHFPQFVAAAIGSKDPRRQAVGYFAEVLLDGSRLPDALSHGSVHVRRAAALAAGLRGTSSMRRVLLKHLQKEPDPTTRHLLSAGLLTGDPDALVPTEALLEEAVGGSPAAPLAAYAFARRAEDARKDSVRSLFESPQPLIRIHTARGLGESTWPQRSGVLANAYEFETEDSVRRAIVRAIAHVASTDASAASRRVLETASRLDPDAETRLLARRALLGKSAFASIGSTADVLWLRARTREGASLSGPLEGNVVVAETFAIPFAFDPDGYALVFGVPPLRAQVALAPSVPAYEAASP